jgi:hypothetical protein
MVGVDTDGMVQIANCRRCQGILDLALWGLFLEIAVVGDKLIHYAYNVQ